MKVATKSILIAGGGTAGWLTAAILAAKLSARGPYGVKITLVEAPDIPIIGVGEGTWPSMRTTLRTAGIREQDFLRACNASFKQGSKFARWKTNSPNDYYYHPFELPEGFYEKNLAQWWIDQQYTQPFSRTVSAQEALCEEHLSPKLPSSPEYSGIANYGYHLDAGEFSEFMKRHCVGQLNVTYISDRIEAVVPSDTGDIAALRTVQNGELSADLYIDCTGFRSLLLGQHFGVDFLDKSSALLANKALAVQMPYTDKQEIASATLSTAQAAGWIWDIGLSTRRGVGYVHNDTYISNDQAADHLRTYLGVNEAAFADLNPRTIPIRPGYRQEFWHRNCVGVGLSAGFLEPLEASAMVIIEASANMIADQFPRTREAMSIVSDRFNKRFRYKWDRIIDFLKLHYILSDRQEPFWRDSARADTVSDRLSEDLALWSHQAPWKDEFENLDDVFPAASYQYVLYGMGFATQPMPGGSAADEFAYKCLHKVENNARLLRSKLTSNRKLLDLIRAE